MIRFAASIADIWLNRKRGDDAEISAARQSVSHLKPIVLVTGGSRGIGAAIASHFAARGHSVAIVARDAEQLAAAATTIQAATRITPQVIVCNLVKPDALGIIDAEIAKAGGYIDIVVNCAAAGLSGPFEDYLTSELEQLMELNVVALTRLTHHVLPAMLSRRRGGILNVSSLGAYIPGPHQAAYYASKAYVLSLTEAIAEEVSGFGVRISALLPGPVDTSFHETMGSQHALYRTLLPSISPERTARAAYRGFMLGQRTITPGLFNRLSIVPLKLLPHPLSVMMMAWLLKRPENNSQ
jgi:short-subunit dehydrogenase